MEGIVLVKNTNNILPLKAPKVLSLFGYDGPAPRVEAASLTGYYIWGLGYSSVNITIEEYNVRFLSGNVDPANVPNAAYAGTLITGGGLGQILLRILAALLKHSHNKHGLTVSGSTGTL